MPGMQCPFCQNQLTSLPKPANEHTGHSCANCGKFSLDRLAGVGLLQKMANKPIDKALVSHTIRRMQGPDGVPMITLKWLDDIMEHGSLPTPREQVDNLLLWMGDELMKSGTGRPLDIRAETHQAIMGSDSQVGVRNVLGHLLKRELVETDDALPAGGRPGELQATLSIGGWEAYHALKRGRGEGRKAFMAMDYNHADVLDQVFECFRAAVKKHDFDLFLLRDRPTPGLIDAHLETEILASQFVIADLTYNNPGAYWEAGFADGLGKTVIYSCKRAFFEKKTPHKRDGGTHFNTNHRWTLLWECGKLEEAAGRLGDIITRTFGAEMSAGGSGGRK